MKNKKHKEKEVLLAKAEELARRKEIMVDDPAGQVGFTVVFESTESFLQKFSSPLCLRNESWENTLLEFELLL